ncbi:MAG TPA: penicillin-binding protein activator [Burkholderiaceae bacterium]|nr:penicillin-binding protein activator [Burkholderiaceae bacterium]
MLFSFPVVIRLGATARRWLLACGDGARALLPPAASLALLLQATAFSAAAQIPANAPEEIPPAPQSPPVIALVLPAPSTPFARAAEAVRAGFFAARAAEGGLAVIQMIDVEDKRGAFDAALAAARTRGAQLVVGPLTRAAANSLAAGSRTAPPPLPVLTLAMPEDAAALPPHVLAFGISIEEEARALVHAVLAERSRRQARAPLPPGVSTSGRSSDGDPRYLVLAGKSALARRVGAAFRDALTAHGERVSLLTPEAFDQTLPTVLAPPGSAARFDAVFFALDAREASVTRAYLPRGLPVYATSLINPGDVAAAAVANDLAGVRFVDMPWLLQPDHPAVMIYPPPNPPLAAELQRLYALGIDAYRIATAWLQTGLATDARFEIDGVTGHLLVDRMRHGRVERTPLPGVFRGGGNSGVEIAP